MFDLVSKYKPSGDQPSAIEKLVKGINEGKKEQVLLGATGTGKTFTIANVIKEVNKPTLVLAHNKTLAGQLYSELKELFSNNQDEFWQNLVVIELSLSYHVVIAAFIIEKIYCRPCNCRLRMFMLLALLGNIL